jgi:hypothetical protein
MEAAMSYVRNIRIMRATIGGILSVLLWAGAVMGEGYRTTLGTVPDDFPVVVVTGTPFEMGLALGTLMQKEIQNFAPRFLAMAQQAEGSKLSNKNLDGAWSTMEPFMGKDFIEEMQGLAQGAGLPLDLFKRAHMVPAVSE